MQKLVKDQNQALAKAQLAAQEAQAKARSLQERCQSLEEDATSLRWELGQSMLCPGIGAKVAAVHVVAVLRCSLLRTCVIADAELWFVSLQEKLICEHGCSASVVGVPI